MLRWNILGEYKSGEDVVSRILSQRGIKSKDEFLRTPSMKECLDLMPSEFKKSLKKASEIIKKSMKEKREIIIFGDYDSDGVNSTAILFNFLKREKGYDKVSYFIPNRFEHSYGLSKGAVDDVLKEHGGKKYFSSPLTLGSPLTMR